MPRNDDEDRRGSVAGSKGGGRDVSGAPLTDDELERFEHEIASQPEAISRTLEAAERGHEGLGTYLDRLADAVRGNREILVSGMGTSLHAGEIFASLMRSAGHKAWALPASELAGHGEHLLVHPTLLLSQSGASPEIAGVLERGGGATCGSTLESDGPLGCHIAGVISGGVDRAVAATRSSMTKLAVRRSPAERLAVAVASGTLLESRAAVSTPVEC